MPAAPTSTTVPASSAAVASASAAWRARIVRDGRNPAPVLRGVPILPHLGLGYSTAAIIHFLNRFTVVKMFLGESLPFTDKHGISRPSHLIPDANVEQKIAIGRRRQRIGIN